MKQFQKQKKEKLFFNTEVMKIEYLLLTEQNETLKISGQSYWSQA